MKKKVAALLRNLADKIDGRRLVWSVEYIKENPGLTAVEIRDVLGRGVITTKS
jgi:hypothetical protein